MVNHEIKPLKKNFKKLAGSLFDAYRKIQEKLPYKIEKVIEEDSDSDDDIVGETETIASITFCDYLIVSDTSNWGAYAIVFAIIMA